VLLGKGPDGCQYLLDVRRTQATPQAVEELVKRTAVADGRAVTVCMEQEPGSAGVAVISCYLRLLAGFPAGAYPGGKNGPRRLTGAGLEAEIEPAIKELSTCLLDPDSSATELDECIQKFEAITSMRSVQRSLQTSLERVRTYGDKLLSS
jgi:hypothetical protein